MAQFVDPVAHLLTQPPGTMVYSRSSFDGGPMETALYIHEEQKYINRLKYNPIFEVRAGGIEHNGVFLVALMIQPNADGDMLYESWLNYHRPDGKGEVFADLASQEQIRILFVDGEGDFKKKTAIKNSLKPTFTDYTERIKRLTPWSMEEFNVAREEVCRSFPSVRQLWDRLRETQ